MLVRNVMRQLSRLARNQDGNALPILAVSLLPILITIGCGIDYARMGLIRSEMQEAVDSAALAGRRNMTSDNIETAKPQVAAFFDYNFDSAAYGVEGLTTTTTKPESGTVEVVATARMRTTLMGMMGIEFLPIRTVGRATQNLDNIDIMLVLDTTGSMDFDLGGRKRIEALRDAVKALYAELAPAQKQLEAQNLRLRIGVLPYSSTVNVGKLIKAKNSSYLYTSNAPYYHRYLNERFFFGNYYSLELRSLNLSSYVNGSSLGEINNHSNNRNAKWAGCIEERDTLNTITGNDRRDAPPPGANDLDIDLIPNGNNGTKWKPYIYDPSRADPNIYCPDSAVPLKTMSASEIGSIVDGLSPSGSTYHDIGMIWGVRMISGGGIFGGDNPSIFNERKVSRHIIYMTDGDISAPLNSYSAYGIEEYDRRVGASSNNDNNARHSKRFQMACSAAKAKQISVWTIGFGTNGTIPSLTNCASNSDQASSADNSQQLIEKFSEIGKNIGALRLSK